MAHFEVMGISVQKEMSRSARRASQYHSSSTSEDSFVLLGPELATLDDLPEEV